MRFFLLHILFFFCWCSVSAQQFPSFIKNNPQYEQPISQPIFLRVEPDSLRLLNVNEDSLIAAQLSPVDTTVPQSKSTTIALLSSMILPGAGQIYNESYWKAPIIWGLGYYYIYNYRDADKIYKKYKMQYDTSVVANPPNGNGDLKGIRNDFHRYRDGFGWYLAILYAVNLLDAYVDAALYNFEVSPNLQGTTDFRATIKIPVR